MYQRVILTSDGSDLARLALPQAAAVAIPGGTTIVLVAAIDSPAEISLEGQPTGWLDLGGSISESEVHAIVEEQRRVATAHLRELQHDLEAAGVQSVELHIVEGSAGPALVRAATDLSADLIVMATHGRSGPSRSLLGSVADHVVRHASCPVLLVRKPT